VFLSSSTKLRFAAEYALRTSRSANILPGDLNVPPLPALLPPDVGGNLYRIVTIVHYDIQQLHVLHVFTHEEYDKWTKNNRGK
jgi:hypothetical protein